MSLVPLTSSFAAPSSGASPGLLIPVSWSNPLPENYRKVENRTIVLQNRRHIFLEMHKEGTRGVFSKTEYSVLKILTVAITIDMQFNWTASNSENQGKHASTLTYVIQGKSTGLYLCMDDNSRLYQSPTHALEHCAFHIEQDKDFSESYYRQLNKTMPKWYIGISKAGFIRCGNMTRKRDRTFQRIDDAHSNISKSPPFTKNKHGCCHNICHTNTKRICKNQRRKFFQLTLKELQKYYKSCILKRHNKNRRARIDQNR